MAPNKSRNQGSTGQNKTAAGQDFRPLALLGACPWLEQGVTVKQPCLSNGEDWTWT